MPDGRQKVATSSEMLRSVGPLVRVRVGVNRLIAKHWLDQGKAVPQPVECLALVDTGATKSAVDEEICVVHLGLKPKDIREIHHAGDGPSQSRFCYAVSIVFPDGGLATVDYSAAASCSLGYSNKSPLGLLLGRDVLANALFVYNGLAGRFEIYS